MFVKAIEMISGAIRPMHVIRRRFGDNVILPDIATLFFVNEQGYALTSKRTATMLTAANAVEQQYKTFLARRSTLSHDESFRFAEKRLESDMKLTKDSIIEIKFSFLGCTNGNARVQCIPHPKYDLALLHFFPENGYSYSGHVTFAANPPKQGQSVCRLGFSIPEFKNFRYDPEQDQISFTEIGKSNSSLFALDGIVTRFISDGERAFAVETTNAGTVGMNGSPLFDTDGHVLGLQSGLGIMMLGADVKMDLPNREPFVDRGAMHLSVNTHLDVIKDFLKAQNVTYYEA